MLKVAAVLFVWVQAVGGVKVPREARNTRACYVEKTSHGRVESQQDVATAGYAVRGISEPELPTYLPYSNDASMPRETLRGRKPEDSGEPYRRRRCEAYAVVRAGASYYCGDVVLGCGEPPHVSLARGMCGDVRM